MSPTPADRADDPEEVAKRVAQYERVCAVAQESHRYDLHTADFLGLAEDAEKLATALELQAFQPRMQSTSPVLEFAKLQRQLVYLLDANPVLVPVPPGIGGTRETQDETSRWSMAHTLISSVHDRLVEHFPAALSGAPPSCQYRPLQLNFFNRKESLMPRSALLDVAGLREAAQSLRTAAAAIRELPLTRELPPSQFPRWLGNQRIAIGSEIFTLTPNEAAVIEVLVKLRATDTTALVDNSGVDDAPRVLRKLVTKYPRLEPSITLPGAKGKGGYSTLIIDASESRPE